MCIRDRRDAEAKLKSLKGAGDATVMSLPLSEALDLKKQPASELGGEFTLSARKGERDDASAIAGAQADALTQRPALYSAFSRAAERTPTLEGILSAARARGNRTASGRPARQAGAHQRAQVQLLAQAGSTRVRSGARKRAASPALEPGGKTLSYRDFAQKYHSAALHT